MENMNSKEYLDKIKSKILENLRHLNFSPSVQMHGKFTNLIIEVPPDMFSSDDEDDDNEENKDRRITRKIQFLILEKMSDRRRVPENELSDSEDEGDGRRNERSYKERSLLSYDKENASSSKRGVNDEADDEME
jgi:histone deacetylase 1/2